MDRVPVIFEKSQPGRIGLMIPESDVPSIEVGDLLPSSLLRRTDPLLPEVSELDVVRHYTALSQLNYGVDTGFYPLGSCTMKYNPKVNDWVASLPGFERLHPLQPLSTVQGLLSVLADLEVWLKQITGMDAMSLQPAAGAHGELTGILVIRAYLKDHGEADRQVVLVPDSAHGTNPATAAMAGFTVKVVPSDPRGQVDLGALKQLVDGNVAGLMLTNPNTLGIFESDILEIADVVHRAGGLLYYDGANANAILGKVRPGDMGFDVVHLNLHKTFSTPHGGGGPGAGPVGVKEKLASYLPTPRLAEGPAGWVWQDRGPRSIGKVRSYYGNVGVLLRAYAYLLSQGGEGLTAIAETSVLNANYLGHLLQSHYDMPYSGSVKHEFVLSLTRQKRRGARALDVAKRLIDYGFYPPTIYFPLVVDEAMMIEPTETESKETLEQFAQALCQIDDEIDANASLVVNAPHATVVSRLNETQAARRPKLVYAPSANGELSAD
ncbi:MAG: aminomethyl-transferring glycine dehydrogenase subunit GcvPB [Firmicutes bacterium]|nr:aminomethyl-transferring glycine dehydrogenase subunit GcvPB [Bacillota bacterium]